MGASLAREEIAAPLKIHFGRRASVSEEFFGGFILTFSLCVIFGTALFERELGAGIGVVLGIIVGAYFHWSSARGAAKRER